MYFNSISPEGKILLFEFEFEFLTNLKDLYGCHTGWYDFCPQHGRQLTGILVSISQLYSN